MHVHELRRLARDRRPVTAELQPTNVFYGGALLLKRHAGLPERRPLYATIEHGVPLLPEIWGVDLANPLPLFLCASPRRAEQFEREAGDGRRARAIGPAIAYAPGPPGGVTRSGGTMVAFPAHSTHHVDAHFDVAAFARTLAGYRHRFDRVQVCVYWKDVLRGLDRPYREEGLECVTAGHIYDAGFMPRLRAIIEGADVVTTNEIGSHLFYSVHLGRPVWVLEQSISYTDGWIGKDVMELREAFAGESEALSEEQRSLAARWSGSGHELDPPALREALERARDEYVDRYGLPGRALRRAHRLASGPWNALLGVLGVGLAGQTEWTGEAEVQ